MMKNFTIIISIILFISTNLYTQSIPPKRELRAVWIATVTNLDWPSSNHLTTEEQKQQLIDILDELKRDGINTVIFQIRSECDAMYSSAYDPWSYWLTGSQGTPPYPYYDPLEFAIEEAHKRGMELHAWFNPYRAERSVGSYTIAPNHVTVLHPDWVLQIGTLKFLNPGLQAVRNYVTDVIYDVVSRYDVDGVHFDDYFYPYPPNNMTESNTLDDAAFAADPRGFTNKSDWRRDNINIFVQQVYDSIQSVKPYVKFGISPFGIWRHYYPPSVGGTTLSAYDDIYCDAIAWLHDHSIDYLTPQLYWPFGGITDYGSLQPWWADSVAANGRHYYPGHAYFKIASSTPTAWTNPSEMPNQIRFDRSNPEVQGGVYFRAGNFAENPRGVTDSLRNDLFRYIAINPIMPWKDIIPPNPIQNLRFEKLASGQAGLTWDLPQIASDGDSAYRYVVYRFDNSSITSSDLDDSKNIYNVEGSRQSIPETPPSGVGPAYFVVTALDRNYNESSMSEILSVTAPASPMLVSPLDGTPNATDTLILKWNYPELASMFGLQVSIDSTFNSGIVLNQNNLADSFKVVTGLNGQTKYFWRVNASNAGGTSEYSSVFSFTTGFPNPPILSFPVAFEGVPLDTIFYWHPSPSAETYDLMVARSSDFNTNSIVADVKGITDTNYTIVGMPAYTLQFWKVKANNVYGTSGWSDVAKFRTVNVTGIENEKALPTSFALEQNYPNPFNPTTTIRVKVASSGLVELKVYDLLGQMVKEVIKDYLSPGVYDFKFDGSNLPSGIYLYRIRINDFSATKKMILVK